MWQAIVFSRACNCQMIPRSLKGHTESMTKETYIPSWELHPQESQQSMLWDRWCVKKGCVNGGSSTWTNLSIRSAAVSPGGSGTATGLTPSARCFSSVHNIGGPEMFSWASKTRCTTQGCWSFQELARPRVTECSLKLIQVFQMLVLV